MPGVYATDGSTNISVVDGTTNRGIYATDGSINAVLTTGTSFGAYHPSGAWWVTPSTASSVGLRAPDGSLYVTETPFTTSGRRVHVVSGSLALIGTVTLTWDGDTADSTPDFDIDLPSGYGDARDAATGDVLRLQYSSDAGANWNAYLTYTLLVGDVSTDVINKSGVTPLVTGTYTFRGRLERGTSVAAWSASESVSLTISATAGQPIGLALTLTKAA